MVELPEDDDGDGIGDTLIPQTPAPPATAARKPRKKRTTSSKGAEAAACTEATGPSNSFTLPYEIPQLCHPSKKTRTSTKATCAETEPKELPLDCWDSTLKVAASNIPSVIDHPCQDLLTLKDLPAPEQTVRCHAWEFFSVPRITPRIWMLGGRARRSYDLQHFWNLGEIAFIRLVIQDILLLRPLFIILSPPCTMLSQLQHSNWKRMSATSRWARLDEGLLLIDCSMWIAVIQMLLGHFLSSSTQLDH